jgi:hypothetical protein
MRYLTIGEALELAELVTHVDAKILALTTNINHSATKLLFSVAELFGITPSLMEINGWDG